MNALKQLFWNWCINVIELCIKNNRVVEQPDYLQWSVSRILYCLRNDYHLSRLCITTKLHLPTHEFRNRANSIAPPIGHFNAQSLSQASVTTNPHRFLGLCFHPYHTWWRLFSVILVVTLARTHPLGGVLLCVVRTFLMWLAPPAIVQSLHSKFKIIH